MHKRLPLLSAAALLALVPQVATANAGTPLMWAGMLHLVFGNALIGVGEGLLIAILFKRPKMWCVGLMVAANYFSAWIGGFLLILGTAETLNWELYNAWSLFWGLVFAAYLITLLFELPFVALCFFRQPQWLRRSLKASFLVQTVSYLAFSVQKVGVATNGVWTFETGFWPVEGMSATNTQTGEEFRLAWETPFSQWYIRNAFQLPDNRVIFQLGEDQILHSRAGYKANCAPQKRPRTRGGFEVVAMMS